MVNPENMLRFVTRQLKDGVDPKVVIVMLLEYLHASHQDGIKDAALLCQTVADGLSAARDKQLAQKLATQLQELQRVNETTHQRTMAAWETTVAELVTKHG